MAFKPFFTGVEYDDESAQITVYVEHREGTVVVPRVYRYTAPVTLGAIKNDVKDKNTIFNSRPAVVTALKAIIGDEVV